MMANLWIEVAMLVQVRELEILWMTELMVKRGELRCGHELLAELPLLGISLISHVETSTNERRLILKLVFLE